VRVTATHYLIETPASSRECRMFVARQLCAPSCAAASGRRQPSCDSTSRLQRRHGRFGSGARAHAASRSKRFQHRRMRTIASVTHVSTATTPSSAALCRRIRLRGRSHFGCRPITNGAMRSGAGVRKPAREETADCTGEAVPQAQLWRFKEDAGRIDRGARM
jgi:hypothetical protein